MSESTSAYVYVIGAVGVQAVKIGWATNPTRRLMEFQIGCPLPLSILWTFPTSRAVALESALHKRFAAQRLRGEWFDLGVDAARLVREACTVIARELPAAPVGAEAEQFPLTPSMFFLADIRSWIMTVPRSVEYVTVNQLVRFLKSTDNPLWQQLEHGAVDHALSFLFGKEYKIGYPDCGKGKVRASLVRQAVERTLPERARTYQPLAEYIRLYEPARQYSNET